jgi:nicotinate-nucleotide adenylyltransferase
MSEKKGLTALPLGPWKRFGILGGSFNPVHVGHLSIAQQVLEALQLQRVFLMPASLSPLKQDDPQMASAADRLEMCRLAVRHLKGLDVSAFELRRGGISYTIETARELRAAYGDAAEIRFIVGSDALAELPQWREARELVKLVDFAIAERREQPLQDALWKEIRKELNAEAEEKLRRGVVRVERVDVSSSLIRQLLRNGEKIPGYLRKSVEEFIRRKGLYGAPPAPTKGPRIVVP